MKLSIIICLCVKNGLNPINTSFNIKFCQHLKYTRALILLSCESTKYSVTPELRTSLLDVAYV